MGFNCLFVNDDAVRIPGSCRDKSKIMVGGVEKVLAIRTYFDRELDLWAAVVRAGQEYAGERALGKTRTAAARHLRDGIAVVEDYRRRDEDQRQKAHEERTGQKRKKKPAAVAAILAMVAAVAGDTPIIPEDSDA